MCVLAAIHIMKIFQLLVIKMQITMVFVMCVDLAKKSNLMSPKIQLQIALATAIRVAYQRFCLS